MSDNKMSIEPSDQFSSYMRQRLKEHKIQPDDACWTEIESRMRATRTLPLLKIGMGIVAAILAFLLIINSPLIKKETPVYQEIAEQTEHQPVIPPIEEKTPEPIYIPEKQSAIATYLTKNDKKEKVEEIIYTEEATITENEATDEVPTDEEETLPFIVKEPEKNINRNQPDLYKKSRIKQVKQNKPWMVAANMGTGNGISPLNGNGTLPPQSDYLSPNEGGVGNGGNYHMSSAELFEKSEKEYKFPLSFGITVRKNISKHFALESGLVYTYLSTSFKNSTQNYNAKLGLSYLGIPVNAVGYIYNTQSWNVYLLGGFALEKGLRSHYNEEKYLNNNRITFSEKSSIKGVQWSINGAVGLSYRMLDHWSIYAEPRISYYFDSNQPVSIRTDKPVTFGVGAGIRYEF